LGAKYVTAALVLAQSLRNTGTKIRLHALVIPDEVSDESRKRLATLYDEVTEVPAIKGLSSKNLKIIGRPDLHATLTKIQFWSLEQYERVLYMDADTLVLQNLDHLFSLPKSIRLACAPEIGYSDCFNAGVMLLMPDEQTYNDLKKAAAEIESFDGGDQGLLNVFFGDGTFGHPLKQLLATGKTTQAGIAYEEGDSELQKRNWYRLSFTYNLEMHKVFRFYIPATLRYRSEHKVLHFIGLDKPWHFPDGKLIPPEDAPVYYQFYCESVGQWWEVRRQLPEGA
jgi:glycogenin